MGSVLSRPLTVPGLAWPPGPTDVSPAHGPHRLLRVRGPFWTDSPSAPAAPIVWAADGGARLGAKSGASSTAHSSSPSGPDSGARCVESGPAVNAHVDAHGLVHGFSPCSSSGAQDRGIWVSAGGAEPAPSTASRSVVLGRGICIARSQGAAGLELSRWPASAAGGPSERIPLSRGLPLTPPSWRRQWSWLSQAMNLFCAFLFPWKQTCPLLPRAARDQGLSMTFHKHLRRPHFL